MTNDVGMTFELKMLQIVIRHCGAATENPTAQSTLDYREAVHCCTGDDVPQALKRSGAGLRELCLEPLLLFLVLLPGKHKVARPKVMPLAPRNIRIQAR
jgi:hypothetical protein